MRYGGPCAFLGTPLLQRFFLGFFLFLFFVFLIIYLLLQVSYCPYYSLRYESEFLGIEGQAQWVHSLPGLGEILRGSSPFELLDLLGQLFQTCLKEIYFILQGHVLSTDFFNIIAVVRGVFMLGRRVLLGLFIFFFLFFYV